MDAREAGVSGSFTPFFDSADGRVFITTDPFDQVAWHKTTALITGEDGKPVFEQKGVEAPVTWSQQAVNIVASKYFRGKLGTPERENSVRQLISRVVDTIERWGLEDGYFRDSQEARAFRNELAELCLSQKAAFNSPVWFNVGVEEHPQCSACFILKVEDNMDSILDWYRDEGRIFKHGSGSGVNISALRSKRESLSSGGKASGPLSFMKAADASAGVIKSGGKTRRAAKLVAMNVDHPDILEFVACKVEEEKKAKILMDAGYSGGIDGEAVGSVAFQNANNSVRVTDDFMHAVEANQNYSTRFVTTGEEADRLSAKGVFRKIAEAAWACGDPGLQFDDTINRWHTTPNAGRINASNPCSEYMSLDDSACNLASINLLKFLDSNGFDVRGFKRAIDVLITAQDILVDLASYPTPEITKNAKRFRQLGLGYANLGAALMAIGLPYDSEGGRALAAAVTALMTGEAYLQSARLAKQLGCFEGYEPAVEKIVEMHGRHTKLSEGDPLMISARAVWGEAIKLGRIYGYRNSQVTVIAPTGTIAFMMDCDTTGIEPDIALVKYKKLVGGGQMKIVNQTIVRALTQLGYGQKQIELIERYINEHDTIESCPELKPEDMPVFDCAFKPRNGKRSISWGGHIRMVAAVQPFLSGATSKTVNMPAESTVEDVERAYMMAWKEGLKAIAIYRDGSKGAQPLSTGKESGAGVAKAGKAPAPPEIVGSNPAAGPGSADIVQTASDQIKDETVTWTNPNPPTPQRRKLPNERTAITKKFSIAGHEGYITVGLFEDGKPGELFVKMSKQGSTIAGLMDAFSIAVSFAFQYGVPLEFLVKKFSHLRFEPSGFTGEAGINHADSVVDYIFRWLEDRFLKSALHLALEANEAETIWKAALAAGIRNYPVSEPIPPFTPEDAKVEDEHLDAILKAEYERLGRDAAFVNQLDAPPCPDCGCIMVRNGACHKCLNCGSTSGCS